MSERLVKFLHDRYGDFAFGLVAVLVLWLVVVRPHLNVAEVIRQTAELNQSITTKLAELASRLERLELRMELNP